MHAIELVDVTKRFGKLVALDKLSVTVQQGESLCLFGPSGCGKTTALRIIAGLELPDIGKVLINGTVVTGDGVYVPPVERNIGMVFQDLALWPHMRAERHIDFVLQATRMPRVARHDRVRQILELCRLSGRRRAYPSELSGGEQQRLALARALAANPKILLLDEPFANLDAELRERMLSEVFRLKNELDVTVVFATHDQQEVASMADRVLLMKKGTYTLEAPDSLT
jgi:iron(III) transport system ATP-binding protein